MLLLTWNQAFYRYGMFDFDRLEACITENLGEIEAFRGRDIEGFSSGDDERIAALFDAFHEALQTASGGNRGRRSAVAAAKALHLLAPGFFPIWDAQIAKAFGCYYARNPAQKYLTFCKITKGIGRVVRRYVDRLDRTLVKLIDEYYYARYTQRWI